MGKIILGDCLEKLREMEADSVDAIVTDPPYGLKFMGKKWDYEVPGVDVWQECMRVLKPGGHMLVACGTRTQHRMAVNIEDAGFEIRDVITWLYGSGFPKSLDISKAIDKAAGHERNEAPHTRADTGFRFQAGGTESKPPQSEAAKQWQGWGTALKPACEFWTLARKPLGESTIAKNVLKHGTGGINVDGCRVDGVPHTTHAAGNMVTCEAASGHMKGKSPHGPTPAPAGRFPANLILDEEAGALLDEQSGILKQGIAGQKSRPFGDGTIFGTAAEFKPNGTETYACETPSGASRFFYCAKASKSERNSGLEGMPEKISNVGDERPSGSMNQRIHGVENRTSNVAPNNHPTVKPIKLMRYLCRLITPPGGQVLDPFAGSGSTGVAALQEGFRFLGIEREAEYVEIATRRLEAAL